MAFFVSLRRTCWTRRERRGHDECEDRHEGKRDVDDGPSTATYGGSRGKSGWPRFHGNGRNGGTRKGDRERIRPARRDRCGREAQRGTRTRPPGGRTAGGGGPSGRTSGGGALRAP